MRPLSPEQLIEFAAECLGELRQEVTFLGGAVVGLLVTDPAARPPRPTKDVDVAVEVGGKIEYYDLDQRLLRLGFSNVIGGPVCRYSHGPLILDVMPTDAGVLGFSNRWYPAAMATSQNHLLRSGLVIRLITPPYFLATKFEAFDSPTREDHGDMFVSRDFEDLITVLDGRDDISSLIHCADSVVHDYLKSRFRLLTENPSFEIGVQAHVDDGRTGRVVARIKAIING